jgi:hypothetical protein
MLSALFLSYSVFFYVILKLKNQNKNITKINFIVRKANSTLYNCYFKLKHVKTNS